MSETGALDLTAPTTAGQTAGRGEGADEYVLLGFPDLNGYLRGKAFRRDAFESVVGSGAVMTDLLLALDPVDTPITEYERFGIRSGAGDLIVRPDLDTLRPLVWRPGWSIHLQRL